MIFEGSRYALAPVRQVTAADGVVRPTVFAVDFKAARFRYHTVVQSDRLDLLAYAYLGNAELWWRISAVNPEVFYPEDLVPGTVLRIPTL